MRLDYVLMNIINIIIHIKINWAKIYMGLTLTVKMLIVFGEEVGVHIMKKHN